MIRYGNLNGDSNVEVYEIGTDYITVKIFGTRKLIRTVTILQAEIRLKKQKGLQNKDTDSTLSL